MKKTILAILAALLLLNGCSDILKSPAANTDPASAPETGFVQVSLSIRGSEPSYSYGPRTAVPNLASGYYTLKFTAAGKSVVNTTLSGGALTTGLIALAPAVWTLEVKGYTNSGMGTLVVSGSDTFQVNADTTQNIHVALNTVHALTGTGTLNYNITISVPVISFAVMEISPMTAGPTTEIPLNSGTNTASLTLDAGYYNIHIELYDDTLGSAAVTQTAHVYTGMTTPLVKAFDASYFSALPTPITGTGLAAKLSAVTATMNELPGSSVDAYTVLVDSNESISPQILTLTGNNKNITIHLRGNGKTVTLDSDGSLLTLGAEGSNSKLTLVLYDITLDGISGNNAALLQVNQRGNLVMKPGVQIIDNSSPVGGGVLVNGGTFAMHGGSIHGNGNTSTANYSGGVTVSSGTFTMEGGSIYNNTGANSGSGVALFNGGNVVMQGGSIKSNTAANSGGGVFASGGTFVMQGGSISGNTATNGGGVAVPFGGTFAMNGGTISGNTAATNGGGVYITGGSDFTKTGGAINGNSASAAGADIYQ
jgi:hypothetical protein